MISLKETGWLITCVIAFLFVMMFSLIIFPMGDKIGQRAYDSISNHIAGEIKKDLINKSMTEINDYFINEKYDVNKFGHNVISFSDNDHIKVDFIQNKNNESDPDTIYCSLDIIARDNLINVQPIYTKKSIVKESRLSLYMMLPIFFVFALFKKSN